MGQQNTTVDTRPCRIIKQHQMITLTSSNVGTFDSKNMVLLVALFTKTNNVSQTKCFVDMATGHSRADKESATGDVQPMRQARVQHP